MIQKTKLVFDFVLRSKPRHNVTDAQTMLKRLKHCPEEILGDKGYYSKHLHEIAFQKKARLYAPIKDFKVKKPSRKHQRRCVEKNPVYKKQNIVESANRNIKIRYISLRSTLHHMKKREFTWHKK